MNKVSQLGKVLCVMFGTALFCIGNDEWWGPLIVILFMYHFLFIRNAFAKVYNKTNWMTRVFLENVETPLIVAIVSMVLSILVMDKVYPAFEVTEVYLSALVGSLAAAIAKWKRTTMTERT